MARFEFQLAKQIDNEPLLQLIERDSMGESIKLRFKRRPNFFIGPESLSHNTQVLIIRDTLSNSVIGCASRSIRNVYVNGSEKQIGYLADLRLAPEYRKSLLLAKGYAFLKKLHEDGQADFYLSTIVADNEEARTILTSGKGELPVYHDLGQYFTYFFRAKRINRVAKDSSLIIEPGSRSTLKEIIFFLNNEGRKKNFFHVLSESDFQTRSHFLYDFSVENFLMVKAKGKIVGVLGLWDQHSFKQVVVQGYSMPLNIVRHPLTFLGMKFPEPGTDLKYCSVCFMAMLDNDSEIFSCLLRVSLDYCHKSGHDYIALGLHESDLLNRIIAKFNGIKFVSRLYQVFWDKSGVPILDKRPLYLDVCGL